MGGSNRPTRWALRIWESPVLMTWGSSAARSLNVLILLPLIATRFEAPEIAVWYLFMSLFQLQLLADLGFSPTFVRVFAYATGGAGVEDLNRPESRAQGLAGRHNWETIGRIWGTSWKVYGRLTWAAVAGLLVVGTPLVWKPISAMATPAEGFASWAVILGASTVVLRGNAYAGYLNGLNQVALVRRWEALINLFAIGTQVVVLLGGGSILALTLAHQGWMVLNVARNRFLARWVHDGRLARFDAASDPIVFQTVWPRAWRSGLGMAMGSVPLQATGLFFAQIGTSERVAEYMLSLNLLGAIRGFAMAPFYSRIPVLARLRAEGALSELIGISKRGMFWSYWTLVGLLVVFGVAGSELLSALGANAGLVPAPVWGAFGVAFLAERYGAMHLHVYSTTNHIVWHTANGVTGVLMLALSLAGFLAFGVMGFPLAMAISYLGFYVPYVVPKSLKSIERGVLDFDLPAIAGPALVLLAYVAYVAS